MNAAAGGRLRRADARDLGALVELWLELTRHHAALGGPFALRRGAAPEVRRLLAAQLRDPDLACFVFEEGGALAGFCAVRIDRALPIAEETRRAEITDLAVRAGARRRGIGSALAEAALAWSRERRVARVEVRVAARNPEGQGFWRARGFSDWMDVLERRL
jgi:ribosomal protein S18 acetylase RimI-like enzyme